MRPTGDDAGERRSYRQVARRYAEGEMLAQRQELADRRAECVRLRAALARIATAEASTQDEAGLREVVERLRAIACDALRGEDGPQGG